MTAFVLYAGGGQYGGGDNSDSGELGVLGFLWKPQGDTAGCLGLRAGLLDIPLTATFLCAPPPTLCPGMSAETGTIAGVASALAMALIGAVSSYISYQQKKFCFSIQRK